MKSKGLIEKILAIGLYVSMLLPLLAGKPSHNCMTDECFRIVSGFKCGMCVEKAIDNLYMTIAVLWFVIIVFSCIVFSKWNSLSPFVVIGLIIAVSIWGAFVDPSKWMFVIALIPSVVILIIAVALDNRKRK